MESFTIGQRVELHPACGLWMQGARYGEVVAVNPRTQCAKVKLDKLRTSVKVGYDLLLDVK